MALTALDRLLTVVATATLTSAAWIVAGGIDLRGVSGISQTVMTKAPRAEGQSGRVSREGANTTAFDTVNQTALAAGDAIDMIVPVAGISSSELTDTFTEDRGGRIHEALDIMAPEGTGVIAAAPGTIERLFLSDAGGKTIYVRSNDRRTIFYYAHLKDYAGGLRERQKVARGQRLGTVGFTGNASPDAPHLHFAIMRTTPDADWWEPATAINPYPLLARR